MVIRILKSLNNTYLPNSDIKDFIKPNFFILLINSKYPVGQEDKNRTCPVPSCYIALREEPLKNSAFNIASVILFSSTFARNRDKVEHHFEAVSNHPAVKF